MIDARKYIQGMQILDLFAGTGSLGFEALSRGAERVLFVDEDRGNIRQIEKTARMFEIYERIRTYCSGVEQFLNAPAMPYHIIFSDPPYDYPRMHEMVERILGDEWLTEEGWFILEHDRRHDFNDHAHCFKTRPYGRTIVSIFQKQPADSAPDSDSRP